MVRVVGAAILVLAAIGAMTNGCTPPAAPAPTYPAPPTTWTSR